VEVFLLAAMNQHRSAIASKNTSTFGEIEGYPVLGTDDMNYVIASCIALHLIEQSKHKPARAIGEKTPNNSRYFHALAVLFPRARFIHMVRDGRDCAVSGWFHNLRVTPEATHKRFASMSSYIRYFARVWAEEVATAQKFIDRQPGRVHQLRYGDLHANAKAELPRIFEFLGVTATPGLSAHCRTAAAFETLSGGRKPGDENRASFFRKGVPEDWRNYFTQADDAAFVEIAGTWLRQFGFI
jgi:hypothetical protein